MTTNAERKRLGVAPRIGGDLKDAIPPIRRPDVTTKSTRVRRKRESLETPYDHASRPWIPLGRR